MIISVFNQKGGVAKSTTVTSLAAALTKFGKKVLVVDMDPQANSTLGLGVDDESLEEDSTIYRLLKEQRLHKNLVEGIIMVTQYDARKKDLNAGLPNKILDYKIFDTIIRIDSQVEYAQENMMPIPFYNEKSKASEDYMNLAKEVLADGEK